MRTSPLLRFTLLAAVGMLPCLVTAVAAEQSTPTQGPPVIEHRLDASTGAVPAVSPTLKPLPRGRLALRTVLTPPAGDKGSHYTDGGIGENAGAPTDHERMKLDRARQAVDASRAAGLLFGAARPMSRVTLSPAELEAEKFRAMEQWKYSPRTILHHPAAGVGEAMPSVQLRGSQELSAVERLKLDALLRGETFVDPAPAPARQRVEPAKVDQGRKVAKEGQ